MATTQNKIDAYNGAIRQLHGFMNQQYTPYAQAFNSAIDAYGRVLAAKEQAKRQGHGVVLVRETTAAYQQAAQAYANLRAMHKQMEKIHQGAVTAGQAVRHEALRNPSVGQVWVHPTMGRHQVTGLGGSVTRSRVSRTSTRGKTAVTFVRENSKLSGAKVWAAHGSKTVAFTGWLARMSKAWPESFTPPPDLPSLPHPPRKP